jgi:uncharacterized C2H2 Zn-finger protein
MVKYSCEKCGKEFTQKSHYTKHINKKNPCIFESKIEEFIEKAVSKKIEELNLNANNNSVTDDSTKKDVKIVREEGLDKFYTLPKYSKICIDKVIELYDITKLDLIIEPSAGNGSFLNQIPSDNKIGIDISPEQTNIIKQDFFEYYPPTNKTNILVIGNPPFGRVSSLAIKFFNHAAKWANVIAFIIPRTFRKISVQNKLDEMYHLVYDEEIPNKPCCFSPPMMVKCCFQIWEKMQIKRQIIDMPTTHVDWQFLSLGPNDEKGQPTPPLNADFAMRAYGGKIGEIKTDDLHMLRPKSWHWFKSNINIIELIDRFKQLDYSNSLNTARQNSMGRGELVSLYLDFIHSKL